MLDSLEPLFLLYFTNEGFKKQNPPEQGHVYSRQSMKESWTELQFQHWFCPSSAQGGHIPALHSELPRLKQQNYFSKKSIKMNAWDATSNDYFSPCAWSLLELDEVPLPLGILAMECFCLSAHHTAGNFTPPSCL